MITQTTNTTPKLTQPSNIVNFNNNGFVWKVPEITAKMTAVNDIRANDSLMVPLNREIGNKLNVLI